MYYKYLLPSFINIDWIRSILVKPFTVNLTLILNISLDSLYYVCVYKPISFTFTLKGDWPA